MLRLFSFESDCFSAAARFLALALLALFVFTGCATSRGLSYPYAEVTAVLKNKFGGKKDMFDHTVTDISETKDELTISFDSNVDFDYAVSVKLTASRLGGASDKCAVSAKIVEHLRDWQYQARSERMENLFLDVLEKRMATGRWDELPWRRKECRSGFFSFK